MSDDAGDATPGPEVSPSDPRFSQTVAYPGDGLRRDPALVGDARAGLLAAEPSDVRRFRVIRPHARGGLGVVFVALDAELNREVALKEIQDDHADDPASRVCFLLEAEITGRLEHPGIVPGLCPRRAPGRPSVLCDAPYPRG